MAQREALIIDGVRSPRGKGRESGSLHHIHPQRGLAQVLNHLQERVGFEAGDVEDVIMGCASQVGDHSMDIARMAVLDAGWPIAAPGVTLNRFCGSGQQAVTFAAMGILAGHQELTVGGGVEWMSRRAPMSVDGFSANNPHLHELHPQVPQGISADLIATLEGFTRKDCDEYAVESQRRAALAVEEGRFARSVVPILNEDGTVALDRDEHLRPGTTIEALAGLNPAFEGMGEHVEAGKDLSYDEYARKVYPQVDGIDHMHHGGNSSGVVDGASALLLASSDYARAHGLKPRARIVMSATAGTEPVIMLTAPAPAARLCLKKAGMTPADIDLWEVNEAFASVVLKFLKEFPEVSHDDFNVCGGAIALGHPIGATGGMLIQTVLDELERQDKSTALIAMCTGGGMGTATIIERV